MLYTIIKENTYQDSIVLMLLSNKLSAIDGVEPSFNYDGHACQ